VASRQNSILTWSDEHQTNVWHFVDLDLDAGSINKFFFLCLLQKHQKSSVHVFSFFTHIRTVLSLPPKIA